MVTMPLCCAFTAVRPPGADLKLRFRILTTVREISLDSRVQLCLVSQRCRYQWYTLRRDTWIAFGGVVLRSGRPSWVLSNTQVFQFP